jgi:hypothetical protein
LMIKRRTYRGAAGVKSVRLASVSLSSNESAVRSED